MPEAQRRHELSLNEKQKEAWEHLRATEPDSTTFLGYGGAIGGGKAIPMCTIVPTPTGWTTMGELRPGDTIFGPDGAQTSVVAVSEVQHRPCYRIRFTDGAEIVAADNHHWAVYPWGVRVQLAKRTDAYREKRRLSRPSRVAGNRTEAQTAAIVERNRLHRPQALAAPEPLVVSTLELKEMVESAKPGQHVAIQIAGALQIEKRSLPLDPYLLGLWLGDGTSSGGSYACHPDDGALIDAWRTTFEVRQAERPIVWYIRGLVPILREIGVLGSKHIPQDYLRGSKEQRLALLQGLMDTDGHACASGAVEFTTTSPVLAKQVTELVRSLGWRVTPRRG
jgi:hypothetical protein